MKGYTVFNVERVRVCPPTTPPGLNRASLGTADRAHGTFFAKLRVDIRQGGTRAFYAHEPDYIQMPPFKAFTDAGSY